MSIQEGDRDISWGSVVICEISTLKKAIEDLERRIDKLEGKDDHVRIKQFYDVTSKLEKLINEAEKNIGAFHKMSRIIERLQELQAETETRLSELENREE